MIQYVASDCLGAHDIGDMAARGRTLIQVSAALLHYPGLVPHSVVTKQRRATFLVHQLQCTDDTGMEFPMTAWDTWS